MVIMPTASPWRSATCASSSAAFSAWSKCESSSSLAAMRRPQSITSSTRWSFSSSYSRAIRRWVRAVAFQSIGALRVALAVFAQLVELHALAAPAHLQHADLRQAVVGGEQRVLRQRAEVRDRRAPGCGSPAQSA